MKLLLLLSVALPAHFGIWACFVAGLVLHSLKLSYDAVRTGQAKSYREYFGKFTIPLLIRSAFGGVLFYLWSGRDTALIQKLLAITGADFNAQLPVTAGTSLLAGFFADSALDFISSKVPWLKNQIPTVAGAALVLLSLLGIGGCAHRINSNAPVSPYEKLLVINDQIGQVNKSVAVGITEISPSLIPIQKAAPILIQQRNIAEVKEQISTILSHGPQYATGQAAQLQELITQLQISAQAMISSGAIGVKDPETQQSFDADIQLIGDLANQLLGGLKAAGVLK
ncbi:MAG TPA: hypothetical protein VJN64_11740 [Terriglobales bacterium]|nr:hypothetical protein [Terriglobales bacterium]